MTDTNDPARARRLNLVMIVAILLIAAATRIINVSSWPVWTDEGWTTWAVSNPQLSVVLDREIAEDRHPPLYFVALSIWETLAGDSRLVLRFGSIVAGLLTVAIAYRIGWTLFNRRAGLYEALLLAGLPMAVYYSQEIRDYGWLTFTVTLMTWLFVLYIQKPRRWLLVAYAGSVALMLYTLYFGLLFLAIHGLVGLFIWRAAWQKKAGLIAAWGAAFVCYIPWIVVIIPVVTRLAAGIRNTPPGLIDAALFAISLMFSAAAIPLLALYAVGVWAALRRADRRVVRLTVILCGSGIFVLMLIINLKIGIVAARTLAFMTPMFMIVCAYGLSVLNRRVALAGAVMFTAYFLVVHPIIRPRLSADQVGATLATHYAPGDLVVLETGWDDYALGYEIGQKLGAASQADIVRTSPLENDFIQTSVIPAIEGDLRLHRRVWLVTWFVYSQAAQYLDHGGSGYQRELAYDVPVGAEYVGLYPDPMLHLALYEKPPVPPVALCQCENYRFGDTFQLRDVIYADTIQPGHTLQIDLWWSALKPPPQDYTVVAFVLDRNSALQGRDDHIPLTPPTQWQGNALYFDRHSVAIPPDLPPGTYQIALKVYLTDRNWLPVNHNEYTVIGTFRVVNSG